jgi:retinol dehydrogenase-12
MSLGPQSRLVVGAGCHEGFLCARHGSRTLVAAGVAWPELHGKYMADGKVGDAALSEFARSQKGKEAGKKVWRELSEILKGIEPGVTKGL